MTPKNLLTRESFQFALFGFLILIFYFSGKFIQPQLEDFKAVIAQLPLLFSGLVFIALYSGVTLFIWLTKDVFKILGAILFGAYVSTALILTAEMINAFVLFHLSRKLGREFVRHKTGVKYEQIDAKVRKAGIWTLFWMRVIPLVPFRFLDLAYGMTSLPFRRYLTIALLGSPVRILLVQFGIAALGESWFALPHPFSIEVITRLMEYFQANSFVFRWCGMYLCFAALGVWTLKNKVWRVE